MGQYHPAHRGGQRHHAPLDHRRSHRAQPAPGEYAKLRADPGLLTSAAPEIIRWQSPVAYMRRTALEDVEIGGKTIRKGEKIAMWCVSGNRDETVIEVVGEPRRLKSNFVEGYEYLPVRTPG
jgi:hypothetical protein